jgi:pimeloyl-ACP methyl ester carboxylesterase
MLHLPRTIAAGALLLAALMLSGCTVPRASTVPGAGFAPRASTATHVTALRPLPPVDQAAVPPRMALSPVAGTQPAPDTQSEQPYLSPDRLQHGYTIVVVGVNGDNMLSAGLAPGLVEGGYPGGVEVVDWTTKFWPLFIYHLRAEGRHETFARLIADKIVSYQARYPGRPVNLLGYSAGAVVAVESLEALPEGVAVDRTVLLAGAISPLYDLRTALDKSRDGIVSYYQTQDVVALWAGTMLAGTADGTHLPSAGAVGFWIRPGSSDEDRNLYRDKLVQLPYKPQMALSGNLGGHFQCVSRTFVARWISPRLAGHPGQDLVANAGNAPR